MTVRRGELRVRRQAPSAQSATVGGTQTLTGKTLMVPTFTSRYQPPIIIGAPNAVGCDMDEPWCGDDADTWRHHRRDDYRRYGTGPITGTTVTGSQRLVLDGCGLARH